MCETQEKSANKVSLVNRIPTVLLIFSSEHTNPIQRGLLSGLKNSQWKNNSQKAKTLSGLNVSLTIRL